MSETMELLPDPGRMVEGLRDTGYQFNTAVADVVDNSIAAEASRIGVQLLMDLRGEVTLSILDDGIGMDKEGLINAMKYGSKPRASAASLGKFGLGLKTASTAFCRRLVVVTRASKTAELLRATWDLDRVRETNKWELVVDSPSPEQVEVFQAFVGASSGTMVAWEKVDRLLKRYTAQAGAHAKKALLGVEEGLREHLGTVYQRFLDPADQRARNLQLNLNESPVEAWDPFCEGMSQIANEEVQTVEVRPGSDAEFRVRAFVLPRKEEFPDDDAAKLARISNHNQGIYVYRENRLIYGPDWLKMFTKEPHFSLLRVEFSFDHRLDDAFHIDIKKSQVILDSEIYEHVKDFLIPCRRAAEEVSRRGTKQRAKDASKTAHDSSNRTISSKESEVSAATVSKINEEAGEAVIANKQGTVTLKLKITTAARPREVHVQPVDGIDDGLLWEPCLIDGHWAVRINTGHPYYHKVYLPSLAERVTIQGMDSLLWGLAVAETNCVGDTTKNAFGELRYEVSRNLRKLVEDLPEPPSES